jgi:hypothetical protein
MLIGDRRDRHHDCASRLDRFRKEVGHRPLAGVKPLHPVLTLVRTAIKRFRVWKTAGFPDLKLHGLKSGLKRDEIEMLGVGDQFFGKQIACDRPGLIGASLFPN